MNSWFEVNCVNCKKTNLINNGDVSDLTVSDIQGFSCWNCKANNEFDEEGDCFLSEEEQLDKGYPLPKLPENLPPAPDLENQKPNTVFITKPHDWQPFLDAVKVKWNELLGKK